MKISRVQYKIKKLTKDNQNILYGIQAHLLKHEEDVYVRDCILDEICDQFLANQTQNKDVTNVTLSNYKTYVQRVKKGLKMPTKIMSFQQNDKVQFALASVWYATSIFLLLQCIKKQFTASHWLNLLVGAFAIVFVYLNLKQIIQIVNYWKLSKTIYMILIIGAFIGGAVSLYSIYSPFDTSLLFLVSSIIFAKRMFVRELKFPWK